MKPCAVLLVFAIVATTVSSASAIPKPAEGEEEHKRRVIDKGLSNEEHFKEEEHNPDYDHEAFLGRDEAETFDDLSPEESKIRLGIIYEKIDRDNDGKVTEEELRDWIKHVQNMYIYKDTDRQWAEHEIKGDTLSWEEYKNRTYGFMDEDDEEEEGGYSYKDMMRRDERRWKKADKDGDGHVTKEEFTDFLHPEDAEHMRDIVVEETIEDIDKNKDGLISVEEYIGDMWPDKDEEDEPDWVKTEREQFLGYRDKNKDGMMDAEEVKDWLIPPDYDHSEAEAKHLIYESDGDRDGTLSKEEVLDKYDLFVGSQATDFGEALTRHDEF